MLRLQLVLRGIKRSQGDKLRPVYTAQLLLTTVACNSLTTRVLHTYNLTHATQDNRMQFRSSSVFIKVFFMAAVEQGLLLSPQVDICFFGREAICSFLFFLAVIDVNAKLSNKTAKLLRCPPPPLPIPTFVAKCPNMV